MGIHGLEVLCQLMAVEVRKAERDFELAELLLEFEHLFSEIEVQAPEDILRSCSMGLASGNNLGKAKSPGQR